MLSLIKWLIKVTFRLIKFTLISGIILAIIIFAAGYWAIKVEPEFLIVRRETLYLPGWDQKLDGLKVAALSDFHMARYNMDLNRLQKVVSMTNKEKPDIIFLLGDYEPYDIAETGMDIKKVTKLFSQLDAPLGVVAVIGNHDYRRREVILDILKNANITILENEYIRKIHHKSGFYVSGTKDKWHYKPDLKKAIPGEDNKEPVILLSHDPDLFPDIPDRVSLTLSGHIHGGLFILPFLGSLCSPSKYCQRYAKGYVVENNKHLFVTSGVAGVTLRLNNPPEIVILNLKSQKSTKKPIINTPPRRGLDYSFIHQYDQIIAHKKQLRVVKKGLKKVIYNISQWLQDM